MRWIIVTFLSILSVLFLLKGIELWTIVYQEGNSQTDLLFLGMNIFGDIQKGRLTSYALGFTIASLIPMMVALNIAISKNNRQNA